MAVCTKTITNQNGFNQLLNLLFGNEHRISWDPGYLNVAKYNLGKVKIEPMHRGLCFVRSADNPKAHVL